jgi:SAM-dependent methyltransferase
MADGYGEDLAYIHDAGFVGLARAATAFVRQALRDAGLPGGLVVDLGCGSGIVAADLSAAGYDVLGVDQSAAMVALARQRAPAARFVVGSLLAAEIPPCVAVTAVGEGVNYLFDAGNTPQALAALFARIHAALGPGGLLVFDAAGPGRVPPPGVARGHAEGPDWATLVTAEEDAERRLLTRHITYFRKSGELYRRGHEVHRLRLLEPGELAEQLRAAGFRVRRLDGYGEAPFPPGYAGFLATKA